MINLDGRRTAVDTRPLRTDRCVRLGRYGPGDLGSETQRAAPITLRPFEGESVGGATRPALAGSSSKDHPTVDTFALHTVTTSAPATNDQPATTAPRAWSRHALAPGAPVIERGLASAVDAHASAHAFTFPAGRLRCHSASWAGE